MKVSKARHFEHDVGWVVIVKIGKRSYTSYFSNPSESIDHADITYIRDRLPVINTEARVAIFKRLYKNLWIEVTEKQLDNMKHTIGLDYQKRPYRNRYYIGMDNEEDEKSWMDLVDKGLAKRGENTKDLFWLTHQGVEYAIGNQSIADERYKDL